VHPQAARRYPQLSHDRDGNKCQRLSPNSVEPGKVLLVREWYVSSACLGYRVQPMTEGEMQTQLAIAHLIDLSERQSKARLAGGPPGTTQPERASVLIRDSERTTDRSVAALEARPGIEADQRGRQERLEAAALRGPFAAPVRRVLGYVQRARTDSLVRNSLYLIASTAVTAGLGYLFWAIAAHVFSSRDVGISSAVISLCSTVALLTYLGSSALLIERLPGSEYSSEWNTILVRICLTTAGVTILATAAVVPLMARSAEYRSYFDNVTTTAVAVIGAAAWTLVNLFGSAFIAARRSGRFLSIQALVSVAKLLFIFPLAAVGAGVVGLPAAWVGSAVVGVCVGAVWLIPGMGLGRRPGYRSRRRSATAPMAGPSIHRRARHRRRRGPPAAASVRGLLGQHLTSVGGAVTPLVLPVLVVLRLGVTPNAHFYITWMVGGAFFIVSPAVAWALFAEGVRTRSDLRNVVVKALRVIAAILVPAMVIMIVAGKLILGLFGAPYAAAGYMLLILLAVSAIPDAVSNVAVAVCRVTHRLAYSTVLNLGILTMTLVAAWILMPRLGIAGVGAAWLGAQVVGAVASMPAFVQVRHSAGRASVVADDLAGNRRYSGQT
jgi:O-antigen/teichoic acid export membrane protein